MPLIDLAGKHLGKLVVLSRAPNRMIGGKSETAWLCRCECGTTKVVSAGHLLRKRRPIQSCGCLCSKTRLLEGKTFGSLTVREFAGYKFQGKHKLALWKCDCKCGNKATIPSNRLITARPELGHCGCRLRPHFGNAHNRLEMVRLYRRAAEERGRVVSISDSEIGELIHSDCHYCGVEPSNIHLWSTAKRKPYYYNGIDRIDSSKDYVPGNTVACCATCNFAKRNMAYDAFVGWLKRAGAHQLRRNRRPQQTGSDPMLF